MATSIQRPSPRRIASALAALLACCAAPLAAQNFQDFDTFRVRYSALPTDRLLADVASVYGITRSARRGLLNIAVQRNAAGNSSDPIRSALSGTATSLGGQRVTLTFREIAEDGAVYYISEFPVSPPDTYRFEIKVTPESATVPYVLRFNKEFVAD